MLKTGFMGNKNEAFGNQPNRGTGMRLGQTANKSVIAEKKNKSAESTFEAEKNRKELLNLYEEMLNEQDREKRLKLVEEIEKKDPIFKERLQKRLQERSKKKQSENSSASEPAPESESNSEPAPEPESNPELTSESEPTPEPTPVPTPDNETNESSDTTEEDAEIPPISQERIVNKAKKNSSFRKFFLSAAAISLAAWMAISSGITGRNKKEAPLDNNNPTTEFNMEDNDVDPLSQYEQEGIDARLAGELPNGTKYDYTEFADFENKTSKNAYGYDYSELYGDENATKDAIYKIASKDPEILSSFAFFALSERQKANLGLTNLGMNQIDELLSNGENGGALQSQILEEFQKSLLSDRSKVEFNLANGPQKTTYTYWEDTDNDDTKNPTKKYLEWDEKIRNNDPQVTITFADVHYDENGQEQVTYKIVTFNINCGYQVVMVEVPPDIRQAKDDSTVFIKTKIKKGGGGGGDDDGGGGGDDDGGGGDGGGGGDNPTPPPGTHPVKNTGAEADNAGESATSRGVNKDEANSEGQHNSQGDHNQSLVDQVKKADTSNATTAATTETSQQRKEADAAATASQVRAAEQTAYSNMTSAEKAQENTARAVADGAQSNAQTTTASASQKTNAPVQQQAAAQTQAVATQESANSTEATATVEPSFDADAASDFAKGAGEMGL